MPVDFPADETGDILSRMQAGGDDLGQARDIDFSLLFRDEAGAAAFAGLMEAEGHEVAYGPWATQSETDENAGLWDLTVTRHMAPSHAAISGFERELEVLAMPFGGRNDGWGCFEVRETGAQQG